MKAVLVDLAVTLAIVATACDGAGHDGAGHDGAIDAGPPPPPIVGDWFACEGDCNRLRAGGLRFTEDLHVHHLVSPEGEGQRYVEGEPYCVGESFATYVHEDGQLTLTFHDGTLETMSLFDVDDGGLTALHGAMRKVMPNGIGRWDDAACVAP